jgi:hypothetical protein
MLGGSGVYWGGRWGKNQEDYRLIKIRQFLIVLVLDFRDCPKRKRRGLYR